LDGFFEVAFVAAGEGRQADRLTDRQAGRKAGRQAGRLATLTIFCGLFIPAKVP